MTEIINDLLMVCIILCVVLFVVEVWAERKEE